MDLNDQFVNICNKNSTKTVTSLQHFDRFINDITGESDQSVKNLFQIIQKTEMIVNKCSKLDDFYEKLKQIDQKLSLLDK